MKDEYDLSKFKRVDPSRVDPDPKIDVHLRADPMDIVRLRDEADRLGIPYQMLIGSLIHRFVNDQFIDKKDYNLYRASLKKFSNDSISEGDQLEIQTRKEED